MKSKQLLGLALGLCLGVAAGCKQESSTSANPPKKPETAAAGPAESGKPAPSGDAAKPADVTKPGINPTAETPAKSGDGVDATKNAPRAADPAAIAKTNEPVPVAPATQPTATEPGVNPLFTLPPSKGPAPYKFQQISMLRTSPNGDLNLEMQVTGDGIYRIRDHGHGKSYVGSGNLSDGEITEWATALKDWDSLKESYLPTPAPKDVETVEIMYGGKKVVALTSDTELPKTFAQTYKRLLALNEKGRKEATAADAPQTPVAPEPAPGPASTPENKEPEKPAAPKPEGDAAKPATPEPAPAPAPTPAPDEKKDGK